MASNFQPFRAFQAGITNVLNDHRKDHKLTYPEIIQFIIERGDETIKQIQAHKMLLNDYLAQMQQAPIRPGTATDKNRLFSSTQAKSDNAPTVSPQDPAQTQPS